MLDLGHHEKHLVIPSAIDFFKKSMNQDFMIFNTKVLKIYDFRFLVKSKIT